MTAGFSDGRSASTPEVTRERIHHRSENVEKKSAVSVTARPARGKRNLGEDAEGSCYNRRTYSRLFSCILVSKAPILVGGEKIPCLLLKRGKRRSGRSSASPAEIFWRCTTSWSLAITSFSLAYSLATALFGGFTPAISTYLIHLTHNRAIPSVWLCFAAACGLLATLVAKPYVEREPQVTAAAEASAAK